MPRTRSIVWSELKLGIVGIVALVLLTTVVIAIGGQAGFWWQRYPLKARFNQVNGLKAGAVVRLNGKEVGKVTTIEFAGTQVEVGLEIQDTVRQLVTSESRVLLGSVSLLGEPMLDINAAPTGQPLPDWAYLKSSEAKGFGDLTETASGSLEEAGKLIADLRAGRGSMGKLLTDPALYNELREFAASASTVAGYMRDGRGTLGRLAKDPAAYEQLQAAMTRLNAITQKIDSGEGSLGRLLNDPAMARSLTGTAANFEQISGRLNKGEGTMGKLMTDQQLYDRFNSAAGRLEQVVTGVEAGRGTVGQLLKDQRLYENMNQAATELRTLISEIRKDPRKYLNVKVSIF